MVIFHHGDAAEDKGKEVRGETGQIADDYGEAGCRRSAGEADESS